MKAECVIWRPTARWIHRNSVVDVIAQGVRFGVGESPVEGPEVETHEDVLLGLVDAEPFPGDRRQVGVAGLGHDGDCFQDVRPMSQSGPYPVAELLGVVVDRDGDRQVASDGGKVRDGPVRLQVGHLRGDARIGRAKEADVGDAFPEHQQPVEAHSERESRPAVETRTRENVGMGEAALPDLDPFVSVADVDLPAVQSVGMHARLPPPGTTRNECVDEETEHLIQLNVADAPAGDAPQVQLMGRAGVEAVDGVAAIGDSRTPGGRRRQGCRPAWRGPGESWRWRGCGARGRHRRSGCSGRHG